MRFSKGHGTQNDFVVLPDVDAELKLTPSVIAALCDRRRGLGADGLLRVTKAGAAQNAGVFDDLPDGVAADDWYMDYRNADGSIAQMCGNGVRVFAHYLRASGLEHRDEFVVGSLAGPRPVTLHGADAVNAEVTVEMGKARSFGPGKAVIAGIGATDFSKNSGRSELRLAAEAVTDAGPAEDTLIVVVTTNPHDVVEATLDLDLEALRLRPEDRDASGAVEVEDLLTGQRWQWGRTPYVRLDPNVEPAHVLRVVRNG